MKTKEIVRILEDSFPCINAEEWDNVGLLVGDMNREVKKIQFSIDATLEAIENAVKNNADMIITHHPLIFKPIKSIKEQEILGKKIRKLIKNNIDVYCIHTNLDSTIGGLNDWILKKMGIEESQILELNIENNCGIGRVYTLEDETDLNTYIEKLKNILSIPNIRLISKESNKNIKKIALINGSAMSYWRLAKNKNIDLFITGDVSYHDALDAQESGLSIIDFGHYESEHFFYEVLTKKLGSTELDFVIFNDGPVFKIK